MGGEQRGLRFPGFFIAYSESKRRRVLVLQDTLGLLGLFCFLTDRLFYVLC